MDDQLDRARLAAGPRSLDDQGAVQSGQDPASRRRVALRRLIIAIAVADISALIFWRVAVPQVLRVRTDIVGAPIFTAFAYQRYFGLYEIAAFLLPGVTIVVYRTLSRRGPLRASPDRQVTLRAALAAAALARAPGKTADAGPTRGMDAASPVVAVVGQAARLLVPAILLALEVAATRAFGQSSSLWVTALGSIAYGVAVLLAGGVFAATRARSGHALSLLAAVGRANSLLALSVLIPPYWMSRVTSIAVSSQAQTHFYPWLPAWLALTVFAGAFAAWLRLVQRESAHDPTPYHPERAVLTWIVGPVGVFFAAAVLPGALGKFLAFDDAQFFAGAQLVFHDGLFPWRDVYLLHGLLQDAFTGAVGMGLFGNTRWGATAGVMVVAVPMFCMVLYLFAARFSSSGLHRLVFGVAIVLAAGNGAQLLSAFTIRFLVVPLCLLAFGVVIAGRSWARCLIFVATLFISAIVTPEAGLFVVCLFAVLLLFEVAEIFSGLRGHWALWRLRRSIAIGAAMSLGWFAFLWRTGAAHAFLSYYLSFAGSHALWGAKPVQWPALQLSLSGFLAAAPVAGWLATLVWAALKLGRGSVWQRRDWVLAAASLFTVVYYQKFLDRPDIQHAREVFVVAMPQLIILVAMSLEWLDGWAMSHSRRGQASGWRSPVGALVVCGAVVGTLPLSLSVPGVVSRVPEALHASAPAPPPARLVRMGYAKPGSVDLAQIEDLGRVLRAVDPSHAPILDYANELGVTDYLLGYSPVERYWPIETAQTVASQLETIARMRKARPPVVIFDDRTFGVPEIDKIVQELRSYVLSEYVFSHYRPAVVVRGQVLLLRDGTEGVGTKIAGLPGVRVLQGNRYSVAPRCAFGDIANFLSVPMNVRANVGTRLLVSTSIDAGSSAGGGRPGTVRRRAAPLVVGGLPQPGVRLGSYEWLKISAPGGLGGSHIEIGGAPGARAGALITLNVLAGNDAAIYVPVGSCLQWHGYGAQGIEVKIRGSAARASGLRLLLVR